MSTYEATFLCPPLKDAFIGSSSNNPTATTSTPIHLSTTASSTEDAFIGSSFEHLTAVVEHKSDDDDDYQLIS